MYLWILREGMLQCDCVWVYLIKNVLDWNHDELLSKMMNWDLYWNSFVLIDNWYWKYKDIIVKWVW